MNKKKTDMGCLAVFFGLFYVVGFGMLGYGIWSAKRSTDAASWPTTEGSLTKVALDEHSDSDGTTYKVEVEYTYTVAGSAYSGSQLAFGYSGSSGREAHEEICAKLKSAKSVDVRYDPNDPASSALSFGIHRSIMFILVFALTWLAFIGGITLIWWLTYRGDDVLLQNLSVH
jgi:hypothetical protein